MSPDYIVEADVLRLLPMSRAVELVRAAALRQARGEDLAVPRTRLSDDAHMLHVLPAASRASGRLGLKAYVTGAEGAEFWYFLFDTGLRAIVEADALGRIRTGEASAVATDALARPDADVLAVLGAGNQAYTQIEAIAVVRRLREVRLYARRAEAARALAATVEERLGLRVSVHESVETAVADAGIVCTVTSAKEPILRAETLAPGAHVNAVGSNRATHREIDDALVARARVVLVEDVDQAKKEAGDLLRAADFAWERATRLCDYLAAPSARSDDAAPTLFESLGIGLWDLAVAEEIAARYAAEQRNVNPK